MDELFSTIGLVSAIIGGFAFTFVGALLAADSKSPAFNWVFGLAMFAASSLMAAALGSVLTSLAAKQGFEINLQWMHQKISLLFLAGILTLIFSISMCGWLRSRQLGYVSLSIGFCAIMMLLWVLIPYLMFG
ncbi:hypothetical protein [Paraglaciecola sp.]|uniref:hypothetical protein n=1 Tax=Paraglaciecola sp. TaxID=1920173 RepID=UPI003EF9F3D2